MMGHQRRWIAGLSLTCLALCGVVGAELAGPSIVGQVELADRTPGFVARAPMITAAASRRDPWFNEILARPLFSPDRRVVGNAAHGVAGLPRLTAIIVEGSRRTAIFAGAAGGHATVVEAGSRIGGYDVRDITDGGMTVVGPQGTMALHPTFDSAPADVPPPAVHRPIVPAFFKVPPN